MTTNSRPIPPLAAAVALALLAAGPLAAEPVAERDMLRWCQGQAAAKFDVSPQDIAMKTLEKTKNGAHLAHGRHHAPGRPAAAFSCRFHPDGEFFWVREDDGQGAGQSGGHGGGKAASGGGYRGGEVLNGSGRTSKGKSVTGLINTRDDDRWLVSVTDPDAACTAVFEDREDRESTGLVCSDGNNGTAVLRLTDHGKPRALAYFRGAAGSGTLDF